MKTKLSILPLIALALLTSCGGDVPKKEQTDKSFFPVNAQVLTELKALDTLPIAVFRYHEEKDGRKDTTIITKEQLRAATKDLLDADITGDKLRPRYTESVYMDQSVGSVTMSYAPNEKGLPVSKVDVYLDPENNRMKQVYVEASGPWAKDSTVFRKMLWAPGRYLQVTTLITAGDTSNRWFQDKYSWEAPN
jgi:hypothetical protein